MPQFMPISWRIGPLTRTMFPIEDMLLWRPVSPLEARARMTGKCSGAAPAMTAFTATFSTSKCQCSMPIVGRSLPTISSGAWLVPVSIRSTRSSVGRTMGRKSVYRRSWKSACISSSPSAST